MLDGTSFLLQELGKYNINIEGWKKGIKTIWVKCITVEKKSRMEWNLLDWPMIIWRWYFGCIIYCVKWVLLCCSCQRKPWVLGVDCDGIRERWGGCLLRRIHFQNQTTLPWHLLGATDGKTSCNIKSNIDSCLLVCEERLVVLLNVCQRVRKTIEESQHNVPLPTKSKD